VGINMGERIVFSGGLIITGKDKEVIHDPMVIINGPTIESVGIRIKNDLSLKDIKVINTDGCTIMPGLIDTHIHLIDNGDANVFIDIFKSSMRRCVQAVGYLKKTLLMGVTTIRSGGDGNDWFEKALRDGNCSASDGKRVFWSNSRKNRCLSHGSVESAGRHREGDILSSRSVKGGT